MNREQDFIFRVIETYLRHKEIYDGTDSSIMYELAKKAMDVDLYSFWALTQD